MKNIEKLIPYVRNTQIYTGEQITRTDANIKEFDFTNSVLIDKNNGIITDH